MRITLLQELLQVARVLNRQGLNHGSAGNISVRWQNGFFITPSGLPCEACTPADLIWMDGNGTGRGRYAPSSEYRFHRDIYAHFPQAGCVLHAHAPWSTTVACMERDIPCFHYMIAAAGGDSVRCAPYATFGSQKLSDHILAALQGRTACLLAHHGLVCHAANPQAALQLAEEIEFLAQAYCRILATGDAVRLLSPAQMQEVRERFKTYQTTRKNKP